MEDVTSESILEEIRDHNAAIYELLLQIEENQYQQGVTLGSIAENTVPTYDTKTEMTTDEIITAQYLQTRELMHSVTGIYFMMLVFIGFFFVFAYKKWRNN